MENSVLYDFFAVDEEKMQFFTLSFPLAFGHFGQFFSVCLCEHLTDAAWNPSGVCLFYSVLDASDCE